MEGESFMNQGKTIMNQGGGSDHGQDDHEKEFDDLWEMSEENLIIKDLKEGKRWQEIANQNEKIKEAFEKTPCSCGCSDGRIHEHRIGRAGEGLVIGLQTMLNNSIEEGLNVAVEAVVKFIGEMIEKGEIKDKFKFCSHDGCGAAKIVCGELKKAGKLLEKYNNSDILGIDFAKKVVDALQKAYPEIEFEYGHTPAEKMDKFHNERAIYLDGTRKINLEAVDELPEGFIFTPMLDVSEEETKLELEKLSEIALGNHGFDKRFTTKNPFRIVVSANNEEQKTELVRIAKSVADKFEGMVVVDGFVI
jgi:hypothetical protein